MITPGPWIVDMPWQLAQGGCYVVMSGNSPVANCGPDGAHNARLISAAPELLELVKDSLRLTNANSCPQWYLDKARKVLSKAGAVINE
jgi:hypothetical protein